MWQVEMVIEEENRSREEAREHYQSSERRSNQLAGEIEELRSVTQQLCQQQQWLCQQQ